jgi:hypothetical protein
MSIACETIPAQFAGIYRRSSATSLLPLPPIAIRGSSLVSRPDNDRSSLLLGSTLLSEDQAFRAFFQEVKALQDDPEEDSPPDSQALAEVLRLVPFSRSQLAQRWCAPRIASDGFGGVRLSWQKGRHEVRAVISGSQTTRRNYIYWESGEEYGTIPDFTAATLFTQLTLLEKVAPIER